MSIFGMERQELASISAKTFNELGKNVAAESILFSAKTIGAGVAVEAGAVIAEVLAPAASLGVVGGEYVGRWFAEKDLPKEYQGRLNVAAEAGAAIAQDAKWFAGKTVEVVLDLLPLPGAKAVATPWVERLSEKLEVGKKWDEFVGIEAHQASATTWVADNWSEGKEAFKNKLASFRGAKAGSEPVAAHAAPTMKV